MARRKQWERGFNEGVMWAASYLVSAHGCDTLAEYMLRESGIDPHTAGDEYDRKILATVIERLDLRRKV